MTRRVSLSRKTLETEVRVELDLDGTGQTKVSTGVGLFDHLLRTLAHHALLDVVIESRGDLEVDDHHTVEDTAQVLGQALGEALGDREGIVRFGDAAVPMDEAMATAAVDAGGRPYAAIDLPFRAERIGMLSTQMVPHALEALSRAAGITLHLSGRGHNDHHLAEAAFKALARALRQAVEPDPYRSGSTSRKGPRLAGRGREHQEEPREDGGAPVAGPTSGEGEGDRW